MSDTQADTKNELLDSLLSDFLDESDQLLTQLNANLLQLDEWAQALGEDRRDRCDEGLLTEMFRSVHSLKGLSAMLGLTDINHLTHKIENVFDAARCEQLSITRDVTELMFMGIDQLTAMVGLLKHPGGDPVDCDTVLEAIRRVLQTAGAEKKQTTQADAERALVSTTGEGTSTPPAGGAGGAQQSDPLEGVKDESDIPDHSLSMFMDEAEASLDALSSGLLALESGPGQRSEVAVGDGLKSLLGSAHKIKGSAASVGLNRAAKLAHLMEDLFENVVLTGDLLLPRTTDILLKCADGLRQHVADLRGGGRGSDHLGPLARDLLAAQPSHPIGNAVAEAECPSSATTPKAQQPLPDTNQCMATTGQRPAETVRVDTDRLDQLMDLAGQLVINKAQFSQIGGRLKAVVDCNGAVHALEKLSRELDCLGSGDTHRVDGQHHAAELESVRTEIRRLRSDLEPICYAVQTLSQTREFVRELFEAIHQLDRVSDGIQKGVMDIRMVPIGPLFARFNRVVRDISRASGKQVRLEVAGEKTELDKRMIDELGDPLVHLVRNSADHGIEPPDQREAAGKPRHGTVTLDAFHRGNSIVIKVRDDGRGLDADRILRKALDKGLMTEADAQRLTAAQIYQLIWKPGLSTADKVTDVSGRGMGMDIVKTKIEELSGTLDLSGEPGEGTTITIKLPLTLAILPSLMVDIASDVFAMPMEAVTEIVGVGWNDVRTVRGRPMATVRGRAVPLVKLGDLLSFRRRGNAQMCPTQETTLVVISDAGQEVGLAVDRVIGEEDVVIKSIAENYQNVPGIAGASILGDGRVALILDIPALIATISKRISHVTC